MAGEASHNAAASKSLGKPRTICLQTARPPIEAPITMLSRVNLVLSFPSFLVTPRAYRPACFLQDGLMECGLL
jgi:hypothetical protein